MGESHFEPTVKPISIQLRVYGVFVCAFCPVDIFEAVGKVCVLANTA